jgi:hypothetical protein
MPITRRRFLRLSACGILGAQLGGILAQLARIGFEAQPYDISTKEGDFVLLTGTHGVWTVSQRMRLPKEGKTLDGVFLETGCSTYLKPGTREFKFPENLGKTAFCQDVILYLKERRIPLLLGDIPPAEDIMTKGLIIEGISSGSALEGTTLALGKEGRAMSRREFLKRTIGAGLGFWGYSRLGKIVAGSFVEIFRQPWAKELRAAASFVEFLHPEDVITTFRNALIAEKLLTYAQIAEKEGKRPTIAIIMGGGHEFISEYLKRGREFCLHLINLYPEGVLRTIFGENYQNYLPVLVEARPEGNKFKPRVIIDEELEGRLRGKEREISHTSVEFKG